MTVGIGVLADSGGLMILATDLRATFPKLSSPNEECGKAWGLPPPFDGGIAAAGIIRDCQPFADQLYANLKKLRTVDPIYNEHVENAIDDARYRIWKRRADCAIRTSYGVTLSQWQRGKVPAGKLDPLTLKAGEVLIQNTPFEVEVIVAGFVRGNPMFYKASGKRPIELSSAPGIHVIGTGGALAMEHLNRRNKILVARSLGHSCM